jgi:predicted O-linked N-acetylglucosamine transferase (SPINDLY family)
MATLDEALRQAMQHHRAGNLRQAELLYRQILQADPAHQHAWHLLGVIAHQAGQSSVAIEYISRAVALGASQPFVHNNLGEAYRAVGRLSEAEACYHEAIRLQPDYAEAHNNLGAALQQQERWSDAQACYEQARRLLPNYFEPHNNLGLLHLRHGQLDEAAHCFQDALRANADHAGVHFNLGRVLKEQGRPAEAIACFERALRLHPDLAEAREFLGLTLHGQGRLEEALACFSDLVRVRPNYAPGHLNLGAVLQGQGRLKEAESCYRSALRLQPDYVEAHYNLGTVLHKQDRLTEARASYETVVRLRPHHAEAHFNLGAVLRYHNDLLGARACFERALALAPYDRYKIACALLLPIIAESRTDLERRRREFEDNLAHLLGENLVLDNPRAEVDATMFFSAYHGVDDRAVQSRIATLYARACPSLMYVAPHCLPSAARTPASQPLRIGFISNHFHSHSIARHYTGVIRHLSRDNIQVVLLALAGPDDPAARALRASADTVVTLPPHRGLHYLREQIADQRLDVLLYTDIGMDPWTYFLAFARLAPVQCVTGGHPVTTGIPTVDYFLSAKDQEPADGDDHYTERLIRFESILNYFPFPQLSQPALRRADFGFPEDLHLYVAVGALFKIHPDFDDLIAAILRADAQGRVVLFEGQQPPWTSCVRERFRRSMPDVIDRIQFLPQQPYDRYLHLVNLADVVLDTPHFSGGTTSFQVLGIGTPIVTIPGKYMRGRVTYACYRRMGVLDCVAADAADYVGLALRLAAEPVWRQDVRSRILTANRVLFENTSVIRELEQFLRDAVARCRGM